MKEVERRATTPTDRLLVTFDVLGDWCQTPGFHGCPFINAAAEYGEPESPIRQACAEHNRLLYNDVRDLVIASGVENPAELAGQLALLLEGVIILAHVNHEEGAAAVAKRAAEILIEKALGEPVSLPAAAAGG
jgi:hypothetical protein